MTSEARSEKGYNFHLAPFLKTLGLGTYLPCFEEAQATIRSHMWVFPSSVPATPTVGINCQTYE